MRGPGDILYNFHWIRPNIAARSAQAYAGFLGPFLTRHAIKAVINLRGPNPSWGWWRYEKRVSARAGIEHYDVMLSSRRLPTRRMLEILFEAFDAARQPLLLKCSGGQDRTSFAAALWLIHREGWGAFDEAQVQFARWPYLHLPKPHQRWLKLFLEFAKEDAGVMPACPMGARKLHAGEFESVAGSARCRGFVPRALRQAGNGAGNVMVMLRQAQHEGLAQSLTLSLSKGEGAMHAKLEIGPGIFLWPGAFDADEQKKLIKEVFARIEKAPFYKPSMPVSGKEFSVEETNFGPLGWISDARGYRYEPVHPYTHQAWPTIPPMLLDLWNETTAYPAPPECCLVNLYRGSARMGLHQDRDEEALDAPVLSVSLGDDAIFRIGGAARRGATKRLKLASGDVLIFGGPARLAFHGVDRVIAGTSQIVPGGGRINLTLRRVSLFDGRAIGRRTGSHFA